MFSYINRKYSYQPSWLTHLKGMSYQGLRSVMTYDIDWIGKLLLDISWQESLVCLVKHRPMVTSCVCWGLGHTWWDVFCLLSPLLVLSSIDVYNCLCNIYTMYHRDVYTTEYQERREETEDISPYPQTDCLL